MGVPVHAYSLGAYICVHMHLNWRMLASLGLCKSPANAGNTHMLSVPSFVPGKR